MMRKTAGPVKKRNCKSGNIQCGGTCLNPNVKTCRLLLGKVTSKNLTQASKSILPKYEDPKSYEVVGIWDSYDKFLRDDDYNEEIFTDGEVDYTIQNDGASGADLTTWNKAVLDKEYKNLNGKIISVDWDVSDGAQGSPIQIALSAKKVWQNQVLSSIEDGTVVINFPQGGAWGARDRAYQRMGFSPVHANDGYQYAIKENGKLRPFNVAKPSHEEYTNGILTQRLRNADEIRDRKIKAGEDPGVREPLEESKRKAAETMIQKYGDWRNVF